MAQEASCFVDPPESTGRIVHREAHDQVGIESDRIVIASCTHRGSRPCEAELASSLIHSMLLRPSVQETSGLNSASEQVEWRILVCTSFSCALLLSYAAVEFACACEDRVDQFT